MSSNHQTWSQLVTQIKSYCDCSLEYRKHIIISDMNSWVNSQDDAMNYIISKGINPKHHVESLERKELLIEVLSMLKANKQMPLGSIKKSKYSIYPILNQKNN